MLSAIHIALTHVRRNVYAFRCPVLIVCRPLVGVTASAMAHFGN